jgi:hypothetical protein
MKSAVAFWLVLLGAPLFVGAACALVLTKRSRLVLSALLPWMAFLGFNLYADHFSPDKELMQGSVLFFQLTLGSLVAALGLLGCSIVTRIMLPNNRLRGP